MPFWFAPVQPNVIRTETFRDPQSLPAGEVEQHPALVRIREDVRITAVGRVTVFVN